MWLLHQGRVEWSQLVVMDDAVDVSAAGAFQHLTLRQQRPVVTVPKFAHMKPNVLVVKELDLFCHINVPSPYRWGHHPSMGLCPRCARLALAWTRAEHGWTCSHDKTQWVCRVWKKHKRT